MKLAGTAALSALRLRTVAAKDALYAGFADRDGGDRYSESVMLDLDYTVLLPR